MRLCFESGVSYRFVQEIEADNQQPTMTTVFKLCVALKITPDKLIMPAWERWRKNPEGSKDRTPTPTSKGRSTHKSPTSGPVGQLNSLGDTSYPTPAGARLAKEMQRKIGNRRMGDLLRSSIIGETIGANTGMPPSRAKFLDTSGKLGQPLEELPQRTSKQPPTGKPGFEIDPTSIIRTLSRLGVFVSGMLGSSSTGGIREWMVDGAKVKYISDQGKLIVTYPDGNQDYFYMDHLGTVYSDRSSGKILGSISKDNQFRSVSPQDETAYRNYQANGGLAPYAEWAISKPLDPENSTLESDKRIGTEKRLSKTGLAYQIKHLNKHLPGTREAEKLIQKYGWPVIDSPNPPGHFDFHFRPSTTRWKRESIDLSRYVPGTRAPFSSALMGEAWEALEHSDRSAFVIAHIAAEAATKECVASIVPGGRHIVDGVQAPPLPNLLEMLCDNIDADLASRLRDESVWGATSEEFCAASGWVRKRTNLRNKIVHGHDEMFTAAEVVAWLKLYEQLITLLWLVQNRQEGIIEPAQKLFDDSWIVER